MSKTTYFPSNEHVDKNLEEGFFMGVVLNSHSAKEHISSPKRTEEEVKEWAVKIFPTIKDTRIVHVLKCIHKYEMEISPMKKKLYSKLCRTIG